MEIITDSPTFEFPPFLIFNIISHVQYPFPGAPGSFDQGNPRS